MQTGLIGDTTVSAIGLGGMPISIEGSPEGLSAEEFARLDKA